MSLDQCLNVPLGILEGLTHSPTPGDSRDSHHKPCEICDGVSLLVVASTTGAPQAGDSRHPPAPGWSCHCSACSEWAPLPAGHGTSNSASSTVAQPHASSTSHGGSEDTSGTKKRCCFSVMRSPLAEQSHVDRHAAQPVGTSLKQINHSWRS